MFSNSDCGFFRSIISPKCRNGSSLAIRSGSLPSANGLPPKRTRYPRGVLQGWPARGQKVYSSPEGYGTKGRGALETQPWCQNSCVKRHHQLTRILGKSASSDIAGLAWHDACRQRRVVGRERSCAEDPKNSLDFLRADKPASVSRMLHGDIATGDCGIMPLLYPTVK